MTWDARHDITRRAVTWRDVSDMTVTWDEYDSLVAVKRGGAGLAFDHIPGFPLVCEGSAPEEEKGGKYGISFYVNQ